MFDHCEIQAWSIQACTAGHNHVPYAAALFSAQCQPIDCASHQQGSERLEAFHPFRGLRKLSRLKQIASIERIWSQFAFRLNEGITMLDARSLIHKLKERASATVRHHAQNIGDKRGMHIVLWCCSCDSADTNG